jgi:hypothetical protein
MKKNVGLIGRGKWGLKLKSKLSKNSNLKFVVGKKTNYSKLIKKDNVNWVFVASPNNTHYQVVAKCLRLKVNVFCEKPLTNSYSNSIKLFKLAKSNNVKLFVSDVYAFHNKSVKKLKQHNIVTRSKKVSGKDFEVLNRFMYHDISILYKFLNKNKLTSLKFNQNNKKKILEIKTVFQNNIEIKFNYNLNSIQKKHHINNINFLTKNDILNKMLNRIFTNKVDYEFNKKKALFIIKFINNVKNKLKQKL